MFCSYCGSKIDNDSSFCPNCGKPLNAGDNSPNNSKFKVDKTVNIDFKKHFNFVINTLKAPITTMKDANVVIPSKISYIYLAITFLLLPLIDVLSLKVFSSKLINTFLKFSSSELGSTNFLERGSLRQQLNSYIPYSNVYILNLIYYLLFYFIIALIVFIIYKTSKPDFDKNYFLKVLIMATLVNLGFSILGFISYAISIILTTVIKLISIITTIILLFYGFKNCCKNINIFGYVFPLIVSFSFLITTYFCVMYALSYLISLIHF